MDVWRKSARKSRMERIKNEYIKELMGVKGKPDILDIIQKKRLQLYGHVNKKFRTWSVQKQGGMAFGFRKTATAAIKPDRCITWTQSTSHCFGEIHFRIIHFYTSWSLEVCIMLLFAYVTNTRKVISFRPVTPRSLVANYHTFRGTCVFWL
jgi:hypothetical protein